MRTCQIWHLDIKNIIISVIFEEKNVLGYFSVRHWKNYQFYFKSENFHFLY